VTSGDEVFNLAQHFMGDPMTPFDRRHFLGRALQATVAAGAAPYLLHENGAIAAPIERKADRFCAFTESFQSWPIDKVCEKFAEIGLDGLDLTVRPGGHIPPEKAAEKLPVAADWARKNGVRILMLTTAINDVDSNSERILATCGDLGIERVKLGYFLYNSFGNLLDQIGQARSKIRQIAELAHKYNVLPCVHVHSGPTIPASGAAAYLLFKDFKRGEVGAYVDPMHMTVEGGLDGWRQGLDLLAPWIALSSMKNCRWISEGRDKYGQERWTIRKCPLADGVARIPDFIATLRKVGYHGLFSLSSEYNDAGSWKQLSTDECLAQTKVDLDYVKRIIAAETG
jgi:sugar phosphate isomerase/epimerase